MKFASRQDAGRRLGKWLRQCDVSADLVLGLPRGGVVVAAEVARELGLPLDAVIAEETVRLNEYCSRFHRSKAVTLNNKMVLLVDDGLATGASAEAAVLSVKRQRPRRIIVAAPVASTSAFDKLARAADKVVVLVADPDFESVGQYYEHFAQTTDE